MRKICDKKEKIHKEGQKVRLSRGGHAGRGDGGERGARRSGEGYPMGSPAGRRPGGERRARRSGEGGGGRGGGGGGGGGGPHRDAGARPPP